MGWIPRQRLGSEDVGFWRTMGEATQLSGVLMGSHAQRAVECFQAQGTSSSAEGWSPLGMGGGVLHRRADKCTWHLPCLCTGGLRSDKGGSRVAQPGSVS